MLLCSLMLAAMPVMAETVEGKGDCSVLMCNEMIECRIEGANRSYKVEGNTITVGVSGVSGIPFGYSSVATITLTNRTDTDGKISFGWAEVKDDPVNSLKMSKEDEYGYKEINKTGFIENEILKAGKSIALQIEITQFTDLNTLIVSSIDFEKVVHTEETIDFRGRKQSKFARERKGRHTGARAGKFGPVC